MMRTLALSRFGMMLLSFSLVLTACGGGGDSGGSSNQITPVTLTRINSATSIDIGMDTFEAIWRSFYSLPLSIYYSGTVSGCLNSGGSITLGVNANGTSGQIDYLNCETETNVFRSGRIGFRDLSDNGASIIATLDYTNYSVSDGSRILYTLNGTNSGYFSYYNSQVTGFFISGTGLKINFVSESVQTNYYSISATFASASNSMITQVALAIKSSQLGGLFYMTSPSSGTDMLAYSLSALNSYPYQGIFNLSDGQVNGSKAEVSISGGAGTDLLDIKVDSDGDGIYETSQFITWNDLDQLAN